MSFITVKFKTISSNHGKNADSEKKETKLTLNLKINHEKIDFKLNETIQSEQNGTKNDIYYDQKSDSIKCYYVDINKLDLNKIDTIISKKLSDESYFYKDRLKEELDHIENLLSLACSKLQRKIYSNQKEKLKLEQKKSDSYLEYKKTVFNILDDYNKHIKIDFDHFILITSKYINYDLVRNRVIENKCKICFHELESDDGNIIVCARCGCENIVFNKINNLEITSSGNKVCCLYISNND